MRKHLLLLATLLLWAAQGVWAQTSVSTASELATAVQTNNANIRLDADILLSTYLNIDGKTVTINLNGHKLYRVIKGGHNSAGHVIYVHNDATLTLNNSTGTGSIEGGMANNGGAIFIGPGSTVTVSNITFKGNSAGEHAGAIWNAGTLTANNCTFTGNTAQDVGAVYNAYQDHTYAGKATFTNCTFTGNTSHTSGGALANARRGEEGYTEMTLTNCTVTYNTATTNGGAIWNGGTLNLISCTITGNTCGANYNGGGIYHLYTTLHTLRVEGRMVVRDNNSGTANAVANNVYLEEPLRLDGKLTSGAKIGVTLATVYGQFTALYNHFHGVSDPNPNTFFFSDNEDLELIRPTNTSEISLVLPGQETGDVPYVQRSWNGSQVVTTAKYCKNPTALSSNTGDSNTVLTDGWYVLSQNVTYNKCLHIHGNVHIILSDDKTLYANDGIYIMEGKTLTVYSQIGGTGKIYSHPEAGPGIGGMQDTKAGHFVVQGGIIDAAAGSNNNAGIGGGNHDSGIQSVTVYGGMVTAVGKSSGAGIGKGQQNDLNETITIYGGTVTATGGAQAAGIGGGEDRGNGTVIIYGGNVTANGGQYAAGIGGGNNKGLTQSVSIYGGTVAAYGGENGAGIGAGRKGGLEQPVYIYGGTVTATGGSDGAGIGGGVDMGQGAAVYISGGDVSAYGGYRAAGIGGGAGGNGGTISITGGNVYAQSGDDGAAIGGGKQGIGGTVTIRCATVIAKRPSSNANSSAIGHGYSQNSLSNGDLYLGDELMVHSGASESSLTHRLRDDRLLGCRGGIGYARIELCDHEGWSGSGPCTYCGVGLNEVSLDETQDNSSYLTSHKGESKDIILKGRTFYKDGNWNTICLPFALASFTGTPLEGATVMKITASSVSGGDISFTLSAVDSMEDGAVYLVKWNTGDDITDPVFRNVTLNNQLRYNSTSGLTFIGCFMPMDLAEGITPRLYLGADNQLYRATTSMNVNAFHGYFILD